MNATNRFLDQNELIDFAKGYLKDKMSSLEKDVNHCLVKPYAPMPAILWCLTCVDLLGALLAGQAARKIPGTRENVDTKKNSQNYMRTFMNYTPDQTVLILGVFRHKLVHLAQPGPLSSYNGNTIVWEYDHESTPNHLVLENLSPAHVTDIKPGWQETVNQKFTLGIRQFMQDIKNSVFKPGGYSGKIETDPDIRENFRIAIQDLNSPQEIR